MTHQIFEPELNEENFEIYEFAYQRRILDNIYYSRFNEELRQQILKHKDSLFKIPHNHALVGHIKKERQLEDSHPLSHAIKQEVERHCRNYMRLFEPNPIRALNHHSNAGLSIWLNEMKTGEFNPVHQHSGKISYVVYIDIPEEIRQESRDTSQMENVKGCITMLSHNTPEMLHFNPRSGDILMFDSLQRHLVSPYFSDNTRITMAGNIHEVYYEQ